jgi:[protein-PII] uridylyltransferase
LARDQNPGAARPLALLALGGYGRGELNPFSDVDVMFVHGEEESDVVAPYVSQVVEQVLYLLWDIGFKVGHSTRSVSETIEQANADMLSKTAMLEARFLAGDTTIAREFREGFRAGCVEGFEREYVAMRMRDQASRHAKHGNSVYMQEPHVKSGCGGCATTRICSGSPTSGKGRSPRISSSAETGSAKRTSDASRRPTISCCGSVATCTYVYGRANDVLHLNIQEQVARRLRYSHNVDQLASEAFMRDYYQPHPEYFPCDGADHGAIRVRSISAE